MRFSAAAVMGLLLTFSAFSQVPLSQIINETSGTAGNKNVVVEVDEHAVIDGSADVGTLTIKGRLSCGSVDAEIKAKTIYVNGTFDCGTSTAPFNRKLIISLKHQTMDPVPFNAYTFRGLIVNTNGNLNLYGNSSRSGHYKLAQTANVGDRTIVVSNTANVNNTAFNNKVINWQVNDEIVIAPSSYNVNEAEARRITKVEAGTVAGTTILHLQYALNYIHWGQKESFGAKVLDERAEVANLTRNILIRPEETVPISLSGALPTYADPSDLDQDKRTTEYHPITSDAGQLGGHVMIMGKGFAKIDAVEFYHMGQAGIMARYPFHWHKSGNVPGQFIKNSSIHRSFQRCITIHQTNEALVENNVCYDFLGHGFFLEDGNEVNNKITKNLGIKAKNVHDSRWLISSDNIMLGSHKRFQGASVFWISNPQNTVTWNIAAGSEGTGFWNSFVGGQVWSLIPELREYAPDSSDPFKGEFDGAVLLSTPPIKTNTTEFSYNVAHSTRIGITWDGAPNQFAPDFPSKYTGNTIKNHRNPMDRFLEIANYSPGVTPVFKGLVAYKNINTGVYFRGESAVFEDSITADNGWSWFLAVNQIVKNSLVVGRSLNHRSSDNAFLKPYFGYAEFQAGIILYDGPIEIQNVDMRNFHQTQPVAANFDTIPFMTIGGNDKYFNRFSNIRFAPEPFYRLYMDEYESHGAGWIDETLTNNALDIDGSFAGLANGVLVPDSPFTKNGRCVSLSSLRGFVRCPADYKLATFWMASSTTGDSTPFLMRRTKSGESAISHPINKWEDLRKVGQKQGMFQLKNMLVASEGYSYEILLTPEIVKDSQGYKNIFMRMYAPEKGVSLPPIKFINAGTNCKIRDAWGRDYRKYASVAELNSGAENGYFPEGNNLHFKLISSKIQEQIREGSLVGSKTSVSEFAYLECGSQTVTSKILGNIENIQLVNGQAHINGWACDYNQRGSVKVHVYAGAPSGSGGINVGGEAIANITSEAAVNFTCGDGTIRGHRFKFVVPADKLAVHGNQKIYVHGISISGGSNLTLANSGNLRLPVTTTPATCSFNGQSVASGNSVNAFEASQIPNGGTCKSQTRICFNGTLSGSYTKASCTVTSAPAGDIKGNIDSITSQGLIKGWSCQHNYPASVRVQIYAGDPSSGGVLLQEDIADETSESGVSTACGTTGIKHRFNIKLSDSSLFKAQDKLIFVRGLPLSTGKSPLSISGSGITKIPRFNIIGYIDGVTLTSGKYIVSGWACDKGRDRQIKVHFYAQESNGSKALMGEGLANQAAEAGVAQACEDPLALGHRYRWEIPAGEITKHKGKKVLGFGISITTGNVNNELPHYQGPHKVP